jgi:polysaccharide pyruvyl transferase WcaK-like protein
VADPACWLDVVIPSKKRITSGRKQCIGLGVAREGLFVDYGVDFTKDRMLEFWSELYRRLREEGYDCRFFCNGAKGDYAFALELLQYMNVGEEEKETILCTRPTSVTGLADDITGFDAVIACRLHASIIAYAYNIPSIGLVWNHKQVIFGQTIGYPERFVELADITADNVIDKLKTSIEEGYGAIDKAAYREATVRYLREFLRELW